MRAKNGIFSLNNMQYYDTKADCEPQCLFNCGMEDKKKLWVQIYSDEDRVPIVGENSHGCCELDGRYEELG